MSGPAASRLRRFTGLADAAEGRASEGGKACAVWTVDGLHGEDSWIVRAVSPA